MNNFGGMTTCSIPFTSVCRLGVLEQHAAISICPVPVLAELRASRNGAVSNDAEARQSTPLGRNCRGGAIGSSGVDGDTPRMYGAVMDTHSDTKTRSGSIPAYSRHFPRH